MATSLPELRAGVYRHYKGQLYFVYGYGHDANEEGRRTVHYIGLELSLAHKGPRLATRNATPEDGFDAFWDYVCAEQNEKLGIICGMSTSNWRQDRRKPSSCQYHPGGTTMPRFEYVGPEL